MEPIINVKRGCEKRISSVETVLPIAYEGINFIPPTSGMYLKTQFVSLGAEDPVIGKGYYREHIQFQVFITDNSGKGTTQALIKAGQIRDSFSKGTTIVEGGMSMHILTTPQIAGTIIIDGKVIIPVLIDITAEIYE
jgi:hypothetical protein